MSRQATAYSARLSTSLALLLMAGCADIEDVIPQDGPTMLQIYEQQIADTRPQDLRRAKTVPENRREDGDDVGRIEEIRTSYDGPSYLEMVAYTREPANEIDNLFPALPNPVLVMYVFPHLAGEEQMPVPGYTTAFSLFKRTHFALPGELQNQDTPGVDTFLSAPRREELISASAQLGAGD